MRTAARASRTPQHLQPDLSIAVAVLVCMVAVVDEAKHKASIAIRCIVV